MTIEQVRSFVEQKENMALIEIQEGFSFTDFYETIAISNGWTQFIGKVAEKSVEVQFRSKAEEKILELKSQGKGFLGADYVVKNEEDEEKSTFLIKYTEEAQVENISAEKMGENIIIKTLLDLYLHYKKKNETMAIEKQKKQIEEKIEQWMPNFSEIKIS